MVDTLAAPTTVEGLTAQAGADWVLEFDFSNRNPDGSKGAAVPLSGYTILLEVRANSKTSSDAPDFVVSSAVQASVTYSDGTTETNVAAELTIDGTTTGKVTMRVPRARTLHLPQQSWTRSSEPKNHYTLRATDSGGREVFALTGPLTVLVA